MICALGRTARFPRVPAASRHAPIDAAMPMQVVATSQRRYFMVSMMPNPAETLDDRPGAFTHHGEQLVLRFESFFGLDFGVRRLAVRAAVGLVDHHLGVGEDVTFGLGTGHEDDRPAALGAADAVGVDRAIE